MLRQAGGGETDDDGVVAGQHQVDHDDLEQRGQSFGGEVGTHVQSLLSIMELQRQPRCAQPGARGHAVRRCRRIRLPSCGYSRCRCMWSLFSASSPTSQLLELPEGPGLDACVPAMAETSSHVVVSDS